MKHLVIRASAGTGKTHRLTNRAIELLLDGIDCRRILASTFTRKAAGEIAARVLSRLAGAAGDDELAAKLGRELKMEVTRERAAGLLRELSANLDGLAISTLDSFFNRVVARYRWELGIPPEPEMTDENSVEALGVSASALREVFATDPDAAEILREFRQGDAMRDVLKSLREQIVSLHALRLDTEAAAWTAYAPEGTDLGAAFDSTLGDLERTAIRFPKFEKFVAEDIARARDAAVNSKWEKFLTTGLTPKVPEGGTYRKMEIPPEFTPIYMKLIDHAMHGMTTRIVRMTAAAAGLIDRYGAIFERERRRRGLVFFSDLPRALGEALGPKPDLDDLADRLGAPVDCLLLDEFQDTSVSQWRVIEPLARAVAGSADPKRNFFCVGDAKQAIYGWRGGCAEVFDRLDVEEPFSAAAREKLDHSYRTSPAVLQAVNVVFEGLGTNAAISGTSSSPPPGAVAAWAKHFSPHSSVHAKRPGYVEISCYPAGSRWSTAADGAFAADEAFPAESDDALGDGAAESVLSRPDVVAELVEKLRREQPDCGIGILVRTRDKLGRIVDALRKRGVPFSDEGGSAIDDDPAVEAVLSALSFAGNPRDGIALFVVANSPLREKLGLGEIVFPARGGAVDSVSARIRGELLERGYPAVIGEWCGILAPVCDRRSAVRLERLLEFADEFEAGSETDPLAFAALARDARIEEPSSSKVRVMTIHASKGLEFDIVILPHLDWKLIDVARENFHVVRPDPFRPAVSVTYKASTELRQVSPTLARAYESSERRSLGDALSALYVAMTRARYALHMVVPALSPKKSGEPKSGGWSDLSAVALLRRAFLTDPDDYQGGGIIHSIGDSDWHARLDKKDRDEISRRAIAPDAAPDPVIALDGPSRSRRSWRRVAPSQLANGGRVSAEGILGSRGDFAMKRGTIVHLWFERISWLDEGAPPEPELRGIAKEVMPGIADRDLAKLLADFAGFLEREDVREALTRPKPTGESPALPELWRERKFEARVEDRIVTGAFDRVEIRRDAAGGILSARILDWKTGHKGESLEDAEAHYAAPMAEYRSALAVILGVDPASVSSRLLFLER